MGTPSRRAPRVRNRSAAKSKEREVLDGVAAILNLPVVAEAVQAFRGTSAKSERGRRAQFAFAWRVEARRLYLVSVLRGVNLLMCLVCLGALLIALPPDSPQLTSAMSMLVALLSIANGAVGTPAPARQSGRQG